MWIRGSIFLDLLSCESGGRARGMFIVFWDTGSHIFQWDPNNNSDSTALFGHELKSGPIYLRWDLKEIGLDLK